MSAVAYAIPDLPRDVDAVTDHAGDRWTLTGTGEWRSQPGGDGISWCELLAFHGPVTAAG